jgi:hypothetical protein
MPLKETQQVENIHHKTYVWNGRDKLTNWEDSGYGLGFRGKAFMYFWLYMVFFHSC